MHLQQLKGGSYASANEISNKVIPRPPADPNRPLRRTSSRSRLLLPLSSVLSESSIEDDSSRTKSGSLTDGKHHHYHYRLTSMFP